jgi:PAS domain S-box-containing protein
MESESKQAPDASAQQRTESLLAAEKRTLEMIAERSRLALTNALVEIKNSENKLRSLRLIVDTIPGLVCTLNAAGEVELLNRQVLEYFGKTTEELKNWVTSDAVHPDDLPRLIDAWRHSVETGQPYAYEFRQRRADGVYRWFQSRALPARDTEGRIAGWYMLLTDIDDRKKAEEELRRSKAYLTEAQRLSRTGSFGCRLLTGEMFWSEETFRIFGYDRSTQPAVERVLQRVHPEDRALVEERIDRAYRDGKDCQVECRLLLPDDSVKQVCIVAHASKTESGIIEFIGAVMDVTAQWQALDAALGKDCSTSCSIPRPAPKFWIMKGLVVREVRIQVGLGVDNGTFLEGWSSP